MADHAPDELVTIDEIARRRCWPANTIYGWRHRGRFPAPDSARGPQGGVLLWRWSTIEGWEPPARVAGRPRA